MNTTIVPRTLDAHLAHVKAGLEAYVEGTLDDLSTCELVIDIMDTGILTRLPGPYQLLAYALIEGGRVTKEKHAA